MTAVASVEAFAPVDDGTPPRHVPVLTWVLAGLAALSAALTYFLPDVLLGPAAANGSARGTALVMLAGAVPLLAVTSTMALMGIPRAGYGWLASIFYIGYNSFLFLFLTPFNRLFLLYVATFSMSLFAGWALIRAVDPERLLESLRPPPWRTMAVFTWALVGLNTLAWLRVVAPATLAEIPGSFLEGTGVATNAIYIQDLAFWLPWMALAGWWLWRRLPIGAWLTGSWIAFGILEGIGIAVDQWFGHQADPLSPVASLEAIPIALGVALVNAIGLSFYLRRRI
jgi:hypothetical protein